MTLVLLWKFIFFFIFISLFSFISGLWITIITVPHKDSSQCKLASGVEEIMLVLFVNIMPIPSSTIWLREIIKIFHRTTIIIQSSLNILRLKKRSLDWRKIWITSMNLWMDHGVFNAKSPRRTREERKFRWYNGPT